MGALYRDIDPQIASIRWPGEADFSAYPACTREKVPVPFPGAKHAPEGRVGKER
jgi:hypothetical protein